MKQTIIEQDVSQFACGAKYLGAGGGGSSNILELLTKRAIREHGPVQLQHPFDVNETEWIIPVGIMGSTTIMNEKIPTGWELVEVLRAVEKEKEIRAGAVAGIEIAGINVLTPILTAALARLPVIDCDGMGRAFTGIHMTTYHAFDISLAPLVMTDEKRKSILIQSDNNEEAECIARNTVMNMGGWAAFACYAMKTKHMREASIYHTFSLAWRLGRGVKKAHEDIHQVVRVLMEELSNSVYGTPRLVTKGKIVELSCDMKEGQLSGSLFLEGRGEYTAEQWGILFCNEYVLCKQEENVRVMSPDLICVLDADTGHPVQVEELEKNRNVWVLGIPSPPLVRTSKMLEVVGPETYGSPFSFLPVESLYEQMDAKRGVGHATAWD